MSAYPTCKHEIESHNHSCPLCATEREIDNLRREVAHWKSEADRMGEENNKLCDENFELSRKLGKLENETHPRRLAPEEENK